MSVFEFFCLCVPTRIERDSCNLSCSIPFCTRTVKYLALYTDGLQRQVSKKVILFGKNMSFYDSIEFFFDFYDKGDRTF